MTADRFICRRFRCAKNKLSNINIYRGDEMEADTYNRDDIEDLAFAFWQKISIERAYEAEVISRPVYERARDMIQKKIERLSRICYDV